MTEGPSDDLLDEVLEAVGSLDGGRFSEREVYTKTGRSRRFELGRAGPVATFTREAGWAVRAGDRRGSFFAAGSGAPRPGGPWPGADGQGLRLPEPSPAPAWSEPADFDAPLLGEREALALLEGVAAALAGELPGARLLAGAVEDGAAEVRILSSHGMRGRHRGRLASLLLEAVGPGKAGARASCYLAEREGRRFNPMALARRLTDRLTVLAEGKPRERDRGELLLAPPVATRLLEGLLPLLVGAGAQKLAEGFQDSRGRLAGEALSLVDDGRLTGGVLEAPVDGEGLATREVVLVEEGAFRGPLLGWRHAGGAPLRPAGTARRPGWRDLPRLGPSHLYAKPRPGVGVGSLLGEISRGYYLIDVEGAGRFALAEDRFTLPVCGFEVRSGKATAPVAGSVLTGSVTSLLRGVQAVARDLAFLPLAAGMIGSPSLLVTGVELRAAP